MNKSEVCKRPGWTAGRVEKFLIVEHVRQRRGCYGMYTEYEYSLPQVLEAESSLVWREAAAKYLHVSVDSLDAEVASRLSERETERLAAEANVAKWKALHLADDATREAKLEAEKAEQDKLATIVRGGLRRIRCSHPLSDGFRTFEIAEVLEYVDFADRRGRIDGDYIREFYRLWSAAAGYCNRKGVLRRLIAPVKNRLVRILLHMARRNGWVYGVGLDGRDQRVLYIDAPRGQVSFHLRLFEGRDYPRYTGVWSGVRNSDEILSRLFDSLHQAQATEVAA